MRDDVRSESVVFVIDDDPDVRDSLQWLLESVGLEVMCFNSALAFLNEVNEKLLQEEAACIVMDVRMPGLSGINAQQKFTEARIDLPVIMISAHGNIDMAVTAMTQGAVTFLEKPFDDQRLIDHVQRTLDKQRSQQARERKLQIYQQRYDSLTRRERQVFEQVVKGLSNQEIADTIGINKKTVEGHRANMMAKMSVGSLSELVQLAIAISVTEGLV
ncbi:response regulator transcription factor [Oceanospirillum sp. D5]|uniref:Response regulator transcription factor n=2 Tax=Oceanospirillum sediminis TaxID=2760088 RepID=A0A839IMV5_9GAMM|nr:response regulator transcription factor [Oceanospirillum sediminis]